MINLTVKDKKYTIVYWHISYVTKGLEKNWNFKDNQAKSYKNQVY